MHRSCCLLILSCFLVDMVLGSSSRQNWSSAGTADRTCLGQVLRVELVYCRLTWSRTGTAGRTTGITGVVQVLKVELVHCKQHWCSAGTEGRIVIVQAQIWSSEGTELAWYG